MAAALRAAAIGIALLPAVVSPATAATTLSNPAASPGSGTGATVFTFAVDYQSSSPSRPPETIHVELDGPSDVVVNLALASGSPTNGRYAGSVGGLPPGSYTVTFHADPEHPAGPPTALPGPGIVVGGGPTPTAGPSATPTATPTPEPTPSPTATARPTSPLPSGSPTPSPTPLPPGVTPAPTSAPTASAPTPTAPGATPGVSQGTGPGPTPPPTVAPTAGPTVAGGSPPSSSPAAAGTRTSARPDVTGGVLAGTPIDDTAVEPRRLGFGPSGMVVLGAATSAAGALLLGRLWIARRRRLSSGPRAGGAAGATSDGGG